MLDPWLRLLEEEAGEVGVALTRFFRGLPQVQVVALSAPGSIAQGGYLWRFGRPTLRLGVAALQVARQEIMGRDIGAEETERLLAGIIGHEIRHIQRRDLAGSLLGEVDSWATTFALYQAMGVAGLVDGQGWTDAAFQGDRLRGASAAEIGCSAFARHLYPGMPLYPGWRGWLHRWTVSGQGSVR